MNWVNPDYKKKLNHERNIFKKITKQTLVKLRIHKKKNTYICIILILNLMIFISKATENYTNKISVVEFCCGEEDFNKIS